MSKFMEMCLSGAALPDEIDDFVDRWHESDSDLSIHEFLGMTREEYLSWVKDPNVLPRILDARHLEYASTP